MNPIQTIRNLSKFYEVRSSGGIVADYLIFAVGIFLIVRALPSAAHIPAAVVAGLAWLLLCIVSITRLVKANGRLKRAVRIDKVPTAELRYQRSTIGLTELDRAHQLAIRSDVARGGDWHAAHYQLRHFRQLRAGQALTRYRLRTVLEYDLGRRFPNVIFDSLSADGGRLGKLYPEIRTMPAISGLDGVNVYSFSRRGAETLSFMTPEVIQALQTARDYDVELFEDRILLSGPLRTSTADLDAMRQQAEQLAKVLQQTDPGEVADTDLAPRRLLKPTRFVATRTLVYAMLVILMLAIGITNIINEGASQVFFTLLLVSVFVALTYFSWQELRDARHHNMVAEDDI